MATRTHWLLIPLLLVGASGAYAEEPLPTEPEANRRTILSGRKVLPAREEPEFELHPNSGRPDWMEHIHIHKKSGLEMRQSFQLGERQVTFGLRGPVMRKKRLGLTFEVRF